MKKLILVVVAAFLLCATGAFADTIQTYYFTQNSCSGGCGTSPYGEVVLDQSGSNTTVTVTLYNGNTFANTGGGGNTHWGFVFNLSPDITLTQSDLIGLSSGWTLQIPAPGTYNQTNFGDFLYALEYDINGGNANGPTSVTFTLDNVTIANFVANEENWFFGADIWSGETGNTGNIVAGEPTSPVPEPTSMALLGTGLFGMAGAIRRKLRK